MTTAALMFLLGAAVGLGVERFWHSVAEWLAIYREGN